MNLSFKGETVILFNLFVLLHHPFFNSFKLVGKPISSMLEDENTFDSIVCKLESTGNSTFVKFVRFVK